jgi:hypothetical protein
LKRFGDPGQIIVKDNDLADFMNDAELQIARATGAVFTTTTNVTAAQLPFSLPGNAMDVTVVRYGMAGPPVNKGVALTFSTVEDLLGKGYSLDMIGPPQFWYLIHETAVEKVMAWPKPLSNDTAPVTITYTGTPVPIVAPLTSGNFTVQDSWHNSIVTFCVARCHEINKDWQAANQLMGQFTNDIAQTRHEALSGEDTTYPVIRDDPFYRDFGDWVY